MAEEDALPGADLVSDEAHALISSRRVEGTAVYDPSGRKLGRIHAVMIAKRSGRVAYAQLALGGLLGLADTIVHPIPWEKLAYDEDRDGYILDVSEEQLAKAPSFHLDGADRPLRLEEERFYGYYGLSPYWLTPWY